MKLPKGLIDESCPFLDFVTYQNGIGNQKLRTSMDRDL